MQVYSAGRQFYGASENARREPFIFRVVSHTTRTRNGAVRAVYENDTLAGGFVQGLIHMHDFIGLPAIRTPPLQPIKINTSFVRGRGE